MARPFERRDGGTFRAIGLLGSAMLAGCTTPGLLMSAAGVATDTSVTWEIVKHVHGKLTEGDDVPCIRLDSVQRATTPRCGPFVEGSIATADIVGSRLEECPLGVAVRDVRLWRAVPELLAKGARADACAVSPMEQLARIPTVPDFAAAPPAVLASLRRLALTDPRAVQFDVVRLLSTPSAVAVGLDDVLGSWFARGDLDRDRAAFEPLGALDPAYLDQPLAHALEGAGHTARAGLGSYDGVQPPGFEVALRDCRWKALEWWFARVPELVNQVPAVRGDQLPWIPLARVLQTRFLTYPTSQSDMVRFLLARGADPWRKLPYDASTSVVEYARELGSPMLGLLDPERSSQAGRTAVSGGG